MALRDDAADALPAIVAAGGNIPAEVRAKHEARLNGYQREVEVLMKIERDLVANGRLAESDLDVLSGFDASEGPNAAVTLPTAADACLAPREAPRNEAGGGPLPAAGDVF